MRFGFSDDQLAFRDAVRDLLAKAAGPETLRAVWDGPLGWDPALWSRLAEMGVLGLLAPESAGGLGLDEVDLVLVLEELGRAAVPGPIVEHCAVAVPALVGTEWIDPAAAGEIVVTAAPDPRVAAGGGGPVSGAGAGAAAPPGSPSDGSGERPAAVTVSCGSGADLVLVLAGAAVSAVRRDDLTVVDAPVSVDRSRRFATVAVRCATPLPGVDGGLFGARGAAATAAVLCGLAAHLIETTATYVKERHQFGVPVGSFQAVKHHLANALIALEHARPAVYCAAWSIATRQATLQRDASFAKVYANDAAATAARVALQCHGAIGYTFEHDLHLWLKRVWSLQQAWGDTAQHRNRVAAALMA